MKRPTPMMLLLRRYEATLRDLEQRMREFERLARLDSASNAP